MRRVWERLASISTKAFFGLELGGIDSFDVDFHTVPANSTAEPLEKHYVSSRSRAQKSVQVFLVRDAAARVMCYSHAGIPKAEKAAEIIRFADFWKQRSGQAPKELVFDSQLTTYRHLNQLNERAIRFLTLRRRTRPLLGRIWSLPASAWRRITLPALTRTFRTPRVLDERVCPAIAARYDRSSSSIWATRNPRFS